MNLWLRNLDELKCKCAYSTGVTSHYQSLIITTANHLRVIVDEFHPGGTYQCYRTTESQIHKSEALLIARTLFVVNNENIYPTVGCLLAYVFDFHHIKCASDGKDHDIVIQKQHSVHWSINPSPSKTPPPPSFLPSPQHKSANYPSLPFQAIPPYILVFREHPPPP